MRKKLNLVIGLDLILLLFLSLSGMSEGTASTLLYYAAFLIPIAVGFILLGKTSLFRLPCDGDRMPLPLALPFFAPGTALFFGLSMLTACLFSLAGKSDATALSGNFALDLLLHALLPALLEEFLLRRIPLGLLAGEDKKSAIFYSALFFSLVHCNLFRMPYAFAAGLIFAALDLAAGSILPSLLFHFGNNLLSLLWLRLGAGGAGRAWYLAALGALTVVSLAFIAVRRETYKLCFSRIFDKKSKLFFSYEAILLAAAALFIAVTSILF